MAMTTTYMTVNGKIRSEHRAGEAHSRDFVHDASGNVVGVYQNGWLCADAAYEPYGGIYTQWNMESGGYRFTWMGGWGYRQTLAEWSSVYVRARHYSRSIGSWLSVDPLWPDEMAYGYVEGRVMTGVDYWGMAMPLPQTHPAGIPNGLQVIPGGPSPSGAPNLTVVPGGAGSTAGVGAGGFAVGACSIIVIAWACYEVCTYEVCKPSGPLTSIGDKLGQSFVNSSLGQSMWPQELPADPNVVRYQTRRRVDCARKPASPNIFPGDQDDLYPSKFPWPEPHKGGPDGCEGMPPCPSAVQYNPPHKDGHNGIWRNGSGKCFGPHTHVITYYRKPPKCNCVESARKPLDCLGLLVPV